MFSFLLPPQKDAFAFDITCQEEKGNWFTEFCITCNFEGRYSVHELEEIVLKVSLLVPCKASSLVRPLKANTDETQAAPRGGCEGLRQPGHKPRIHGPCTTAPSPQPHVIISSSHEKQQKSFWLKCLKATVPCSHKQVAGAGGGTG